METRELKEVITVGALIRGRVRRLLRNLDIPFQEDKGLLDSCFFISRQDAQFMADTLKKAKLLDNK